MADFKRLGDIATYINGFAFKPEDRGNVGLPIIRIQDLTGSFSDTGYYDGEYPSKIEINNGDVLISWSASLGVYVWNRGKALLNQHIFKVVFDKEEVDKDYFVYAIQYYLKEMEQKTHGATMKHIIKKDFDNTLIPFPNIEKQREISRILNNSNKIVLARQQELQKLDELVKARFVELFGDPLTGDIRYELQTVGDVADMVDPQPSHRTPPIVEDGIPYISIKDCNYKTGFIDFENARKVSSHVLEEHLSRYTLHEGDFIIGKIGTIGNPIFIPERQDYTLSANIVLIQPKRESVSPYFLKFSFMSAFVERQFDEAKNSTSQAAFGIQKVRTIKILKPETDKQYAFEKFAKQVDKSKYDKFIYLCNIIKNAVIEEVSP